MLTDSFQRTIKYLRVSITDRCNLRCSYCRPEKCGNTSSNFEHIQHNEIMTYEELLRLSSIFARLGVEKIRVTGGEPLVRKNVPEFVGDLLSIKGIRDVSLTTNGVLLQDYAEALKTKGLKRINISLDSLVPDKFSQITGRNEFARVWKGIQTVIELGLDPVKINVVAMRGINDDEFLDFAALTLAMPVHVRFIEFMPMAFSADDSAKNRILSSEIIEKIESKWKLESVPKPPSSGPAECFRIKDAPGTIGFISPISRHFCGECNRMRITAAGSLKPCLLSHDEIDIKAALRSGADDDYLENLIYSAAAIKWKRHEIENGMSPNGGSGGIMFRIGG